MAFNYCWTQTQENLQPVLFYFRSIFSAIYDVKLEEADTGADEPTDEIGFAQSRTGTQSRGNRSTSVLSPGLRSNTPPKIDKRLTEIYVSIVQWNIHVLLNVHLVWKLSSKWDFHSYTYLFLLHSEYLWKKNKLLGCLPWKWLSKWDFHLFISTYMLQYPSKSVDSSF